jgi:hypothetical protein
MAAGGGGGAGCWGRKTILNPTATAFVIGAGGTGVAGAAGNTGGSTTFGAVLTLPGGGGGALGFANTANMLTSNASAFSGAATGADISSQGACGFAGIILSANISTSGFGANSQFGSGGPSVQVSSATFANGVVGVGFGSGGSGSCSGTNVGATLSGAAGRQGLLIAYEYN